MNHVPRSWLIRLQGVLLLLDIVILGAYAYIAYLAAPDAAQHMATQTMHQHAAGGEAEWGIGTLVAVLAGAHMLWCLGVLWWLEKKNVWAAYGIATILSGLMLVLLSAGDSSMHYWYHALMVVFMFFAAMCGPLTVGVVASFGFATLIFASIGSGTLTHDPTTHVVEMVIVATAAGSGALGWWFFRRKYIQRVDSPQLEALHSLVKQERTTVGLVLESITDGVMIIDSDGVVQVLNASCAKLLGWTKEEANGLHYNSLLEPASATEKLKPQAKSAEPEPKETLAITDTFNSNRAQHKVSLVKTHEGRQIYVDIAASPIFQEGQRPEDQTELTMPAPKKIVGVIVVLRDVDKRQREEAQRSEFISTASHEMRTPVAAIEGYLALAMNEKVSTIDAKARSYLEKAYASTQHLGHLFQDLLTSAKVEDGRLISHAVPVEMGQFLEQLVDSLRFSAEKKGLQVGLTIGTNAAANVPGGMQKMVKPFYYVLADPERLREVITNLFDNAVKYSNEGKIAIGLTGNDEVVQFFIKDTGMGIPAEDVGHLFQKFYRVDNSDTRTIGGTGLGLFICRKIIELYQGKIWVESELHKGSTFYINLPRIDTQKAESIKAQGDNSMPAIPPMPTATPSVPPPPPPPTATPPPPAAPAAPTTATPLTPGGS